MLSDAILLFWYSIFTKMILFVKKNSHETYFRLDLAEASLDAAASFTQSESLVESLKENIYSCVDKGPHTIFVLLTSLSVSYIQ